MVQKVAVRCEFEAGLHHATTGKILSVNPAVNGTFTESEKDKAEKGEGGRPFHQLCPRYSGPLTPIAPTAIRLWETFTFYWKPIKGSYANSADSDQMPHSVASDQGLHCLLTGFSIKNKIKATNRPNTPKMTNGLIQHITVEESTSIQ